MLNITPQVGIERIEVKFEILEEEGGEVLHTVNTAFPLETSAEDIKAEGQKAHDLFFSERAQAEEQSKVDERYDGAKATVAELTGEVAKENEEPKSEVVQ